MNRFPAAGYVLEIAEAFKSSDAEELHRILEEKQQAILADSNMGLAKQAPFETKNTWKIRWRYFCCDKGGMVESYWQGEKGDSVIFETFLDG